MYFRRIRRSKGPRGLAIENCATSIAGVGSSTLSITRTNSLSGPESFAVTGDQHVLCIRLFGSYRAVWGMAI